MNAGGVIQVSDELHGFDFERAKKGAAAIFDHTLEVLETADERGITPPRPRTRSPRSGWPRPRRRYLAARAVSRVSCLTGATGRPVRQEVDAKFASLL